MKNTFFEKTAIKYNSLAINTLSFNIQPHCKCFRLHWHDRMEILYVKHGRMYVKYGKTSAIVSAGELMIIHPKTFHEGYTLDEYVEYIGITFDVRSFYNETDICKKLLPAIYDGRAKFKTITSDTETVQCFNDIYQGSNMSSLETTSKIYQLFNLFYQNNLLEMQTHPKDELAKKIVDFIEKNATQEINIDSICQEFLYSKAHICRKFKQATGLPMLAYLKIYRLELSRKKILDKATNISNIAAECGFSDANYFTRCFKAHFGISPMQYRKLYAENKEYYNI